MKRRITKEEYENAVRIRAKIANIVNISLTLISIVVILVSVFLAMFNVMSYTVMGVIVPLALIVYLAMGVISQKNDSRKSVMIVYIVLISICAIVFFVDFVYLLIS